jgi:hypothetical protein
MTIVRSISVSFPLRGLLVVDEPIEETSARLQRGKTTGAGR